MSRELRQRPSLYVSSGRRKYIDRSERDRLLTAARERPLAEMAFVMTLVFTGCRLSEALTLPIEAVQPSQGVVAFRSLKKRGILSVREVPAPPELLEVFGRLNVGSGPVWSWSRTSAWRIVTKLMKDCDINGPQASPKGLRHGFGVHAVQSGIPLNLIQRWLGHSDMKTTAIYTDVAGKDELDIASRMWRRA